MRTTGISLIWPTLKILSTKSFQLQGLVEIDRNPVPYIVCLVELVSRLKWFRGEPYQIWSGSILHRILNLLPLKDSLWIRQNTLHYLAKYSISFQHKLNLSIQTKWPCPLVWFNLQHMLFLLTTVLKPASPFETNLSVSVRTVWS